MKKALVAGHICLDVTPIFKNQNSVDKEKLLEPGKLIVMGAADIHTGGVVSNTGLAMRYFGADVQLLAKIGDDAFGNIITSILDKNGADYLIKSDKRCATSYSVVIAIPGIDRTFLHCPGTNDEFTADDITENDISDKTLVHFGYPTLMRKMFLDEGKELSKLYKKLKKANKVTSLDTSSVDPASEAGAADWEKILTDTLPFVDFFLPSFEELCYMLDREKYDELSKLGDVCENICVSDVKALADKVLELGASFVLIKCGAAGMYYACPKNPVFVKPLGLKNKEWSEKCGFVKSFLPSEVLSGTGAGDTAIAAFLTCVLKGYSAERCVNLAAAAGAACVEAYDAISGLKPLGKLEEKINAGWRRQNIIKEN